MVKRRTFTITRQVTYWYCGRCKVRHRLKSAAEKCRKKAKYAPRTDYRERNTEIWKRCQAGETRRAIAADHGISAGRVTDIYMKYLFKIEGEIRKRSDRGEDHAQIAESLGIEVERLEAIIAQEAAREEMWAANARKRRAEIEASGEDKPWIDPEMTKLAATPFRLVKT